MSINGAFNNAASGLAATSRLVETISSNVANASTPGYARRVTELSSSGLSGYSNGVSVRPTTRTENAFVTSERRAMDAALGAAGTTAATHNAIAEALGEPGSAGSLAARATALESKLMATISEPQSLSRLADAVNGASALASKITSIAGENLRLRSEADSQIAAQVNMLNDTLRQVRDLNEKIVKLTQLGEDVNGLRDERDKMIDRISPIVPIKTINRDSGGIAIYAANGAVLLDTNVFELSFTPGPSVITPDMTVGAQLSGLFQDQGKTSGPVEIKVGGGAGLMDGGSLAALFETRDRIVPEFDRELDLYAAELIDRFQSLSLAGADLATALDGAGGGLFVDAAPGATLGVASRLRLNAAVDPAQGGETWRLRAGLSAAAQGDEGFGGYLQALADAMSVSRTPAGFVSQNAANSGAIVASEITSFFAGKSARSDDAQAFLTSRQTVLSDSETNSVGVDTDKELQTLMLVEQAYAANARVLSVIDGLLQTLLEV
jgi:flagellar hook-associated protein 1